MHLTEIILKVWVIYGQYTIDVSKCEVDPDADSLLFDESKAFMHSASYEYRHVSPRRGIHFVPMENSIICWKTYPAKLRIGWLHNLAELSMLYVILRYHINKLVSELYAAMTLTKI